jgi:hypothetical protein
VTAVDSGSRAAGASRRTGARHPSRTRADSPRLTAGIAALVLAAAGTFVVLDYGAAHESLPTLRERRWGILTLLLIAAAGWIFTAVFAALRIRHVRRIARRCRLEHLANAWTPTVSQAPDSSPPPTGAV